MSLNPSRSTVRTLSSAPGAIRSSRWVRARRLPRPVSGSFDASRVSESSNARRWTPIALSRAPNAQTTTRISSTDPWSSGGRTSAVEALHNRSTKDSIEVREDTRVCAVWLFLAVAAITAVGGGRLMPAATAGHARHHSTAAHQGTGPPARPPDQSVTRSAHPYITPPARARPRLRSGWRSHSSNSSEMTLVSTMSGRPTAAMLMTSGPTSFSAPANPSRQTSNADVLPTSTPSKAFGVPSTPGLRSRTALSEPATTKSAATRPPRWTLSGENAVPGAGSGCREAGWCPR